MKWIILSQTVAVVAAGVILPFYIVYLKDAADSYSLFAYLYATFTLAAALTHYWSEKITKILSVRWMLVVGCGVAGLTLFAVPSLDALWQVYVVQVVLGISLSMQKTGEKIAVAASVNRHTRAHKIGEYHAIVAVFTAAMLFASGWFLDTFSLEFMFYIMGMLLIVSAILSSNVRVSS